jgi:formate dehydrogenase beta subunit
MIEMNDLKDVAPSSPCELAFSSWGGTIYDGRSGSAGPEPVLPASFALGRAVKALIGWDGIVLRDPDVNVVDLCSEYVHKLSESSCGKCAPCPAGYAIMTELLDNICAGKGRMADLDQLRSISDVLIKTSRCGIGQVGPVALVKALNHFPEEFAAAIASGVERRGEYRSKLTAPCIDACPMHLDIPMYVDLIRQGRFKESLASIRRRLPLPGCLGRGCFRPCESSCRRSNMDAPIAIKSLKRYVADEMERKGEVLSSSCLDVGIAPGAVGRIAIIGSGVAGLTCAYHLAQFGHRVRIYEALDEPGGMAAVGIPAYRLPQDVLRREVATIEALGVEIIYGVKIGRDIMMNDLMANNDAVFIAIGAQGSSSMRVEGEDEDYAGFIPGIRYLRSINGGVDPYPQGRHVAVIGGGNVAFDCVRTALRLKKDRVSMLYRRTRAEMPADPMEIEEAEEEGVDYNFLTAPLRIIAEEGRVVGLECQRMALGEPDESGRRRPEPIPDSEFVIECDTIVPAIGQTINLSLLQGIEGVETSRGKTIVVDPITYQSTVPKIFSAGDCETGPGLLIAASAGGLRAALSIHQFLQGEDPSVNSSDGFEELFDALPLFNPAEEMDKVATEARAEMAILEPEVRVKSYDEIELGFTREEAVAEASRCLQCYRVLTVAV